MIGDGTERIALDSSREQTERTRAFCESIKPVSTSHQKMLDAIGAQLDTLDEIHRIAEGLGGGADIGRMLWLCHRQLYALQAASSAIVVELADKFTDTEELPVLTPDAERALLRRYGHADDPPALQSEALPAG